MGLHTASPAMMPPLKGFSEDSRLKQGKELPTVILLESW
jgi:hypothetical protein